MTEEFELKSSFVKRIKETRVEWNGKKDKKKMELGEAVDEDLRLPFNLNIISCGVTNTGYDV